MTTAGSHIGELALRRRQAGETLTSDEETHAAACPECRARGRTLDDEQRRFEQEISFDRFAAGVERAARGDRAARRRPGLVRLWMMAPVLAAAAAVAAAITFAPGELQPNRIKGGAGITVRVAGATGPQRTAAVSAPEALARGERVRIGYEPGAHRFLLALSIDDHGAVTPLYPEAGRSLPAARAAGGGVRYLPDGIELTGAGAERLVVILSDQPLEVEAARRAARLAYDRAKGDLLHLPPLDLPGEQFQRTFLKP
jgi:hypothetical protein